MQKLKSSSAFSGADLSAMLTAATPPITIAISGKDDLLSSLETRLAKEVFNLTIALTKFSSGVEAIGKELPDSSHFGKLVTLFFSMSSLQVAHALLQRPDLPLLVDDGFQQLQELGLSLNEFIREVDLDGRRFLAVALINVDSQPCQVVESQEEQDTTPPEQTALRQYQLALRCQMERIYSVRQQATSIAGMLRQKPLDWGGTAPKRPLHKEALPVLPWRVRHRG